VKLLVIFNKYCGIILEEENKKRKTGDGRNK